MNYKILPRIVLVIVVVLLLGASIELAGMYYLVQDTAENVKVVYLDAKYKILDNLFDREMTSMTTLLKDYSEWDDLYYNVVGQDYDWAYDNATGFLVDDASYHIDFVYVESVVNDYYEYHGSEALEDLVSQTELYQKIEAERRILLDVVILEDDIYMIAGGPIVRSSEFGKRYGSLGYYIAGRKLDDAYIHEILASYLPNSEYIGLNTIHGDLEAITQNRNLAILTYPILDIKGQHLRDIKAYFNLELYNENYNNFFLHTIAVTFFVLIIILFGVIVLVYKSYGILDKAIIGVDRVASGDYRHQIGFTKYYEINNVIRHVNQMGVKIQDKIESLQEHNIETMEILIHAVEEKDLYTRGHSERVKDISVVLATKIGCVDMERIEQAALLHDIGKIGIHDEILNKPDRLTNEEYEIIKEHPAKGERILSSSTRMQQIGKIVRQHHEWFDGSGYPDGIAGADIALEARIISVADAFDAITSKRPYRIEKSFKTGVKILESSKGTQFDPKIVDIFIEVIDDIRPIIE